MNCCPSLSPFPVSKYSTEYTDSVWLEGVGVLGPVGDHILHEFNKVPLRHFVLVSVQLISSCVKDKKTLGENVMRQGSTLL